MFKISKSKGHEICELKFLDLKKLEDNCNKLKKNLAKKFEKEKLEI